MVMKNHKHFLLDMAGWTLVLFVMSYSLTLSAADAELPDSLSDYRLATGDKLRIQVYGEDDLYLETRVNDQGVISYPFLGNLKVLGLSPRQLEELIASRLRDGYLINPRVSVDISEYRLFYVNGEVENPGGFPFQPGMTVHKAISLAGGFKERASKDKIFIIRDGDADTKPVKTSLDGMVRPGDIITVEQSFF